MALFPTSLKSAALPQGPQDERRSWWTSLFVLCAVLGALMGLSFKTQNAIRRNYLPASNYPALAQEYLILKKNVNDQQSTIKQLNQTVTKLESGTLDDSKAVRALNDDLRRAKFLAGLTDVQGTGVVVTLNDGPHLPGLPAAAIMPTLVHDTDINQTVNELKAAGAEAIAINSQRLVADSAIRCAGPTVYVNNTPQTPPYVIRAIGDPVTMQAALNLPGGVVEQLGHFASIKIQKVARVRIPAYAGATQPRYARPVPGSEGGSQVAKTPEG